MQFRPRRVRCSVCVACRSKSTQRWKRRKKIIKNTGSRWRTFYCPRGTEVQSTEATLWVKAKVIMCVSMLCQCGVGCPLWNSTSNLVFDHSCTGSPWTRNRYRHVYSGWPQLLSTRSSIIWKASVLFSWKDSVNDINIIINRRCTDKAYLFLVQCVQLVMIKEHRTEHWELTRAAYLIMVSHPAIFIISTLNQRHTTGGDKEHNSTGTLNYSTCSLYSLYIHEICTRK